MRRLMLLASVVIFVGFVLLVGTAGGARSGQARWVTTDLGVLGGTRSEALAINEGGQVVGYAVAADGASHAFLWQKGRMRYLGVVTHPGFYASRETFKNLHARPTLRRWANAAPLTCAECSRVACDDAMGWRALFLRSLPTINSR